MMVDLRSHLQFAGIFLAILCEAALFASSVAPGLPSDGMTALGASAYFLMALISALLVLSIGMYLRLWLTEPGQLPTSFELQYLLATNKVEHKTARDRLNSLYAEAFSQAASDSSFNPPAEWQSWLEVALRPPALGDADTLPGDLVWCRSCKIWRPQGCYHCMACGRCCLGYDIHCAALGVCIGQRNRQHLLSVCALGIVCAGMIFISSFAELTHFFMSAELPPLELGASFGTYDVPALDRFRTLTFFVFCVSFAVILAEKALPLLERYFGTLRFVSRILGCFIYPGIINRLALFCCALQALHMLGQGTLKSSAIFLSVSVTLSYYLACAAGGGLAMQLDILFGGASAKRDAEATKTDVELVPYDCSGVWRFYNTPVPSSVLFDNPSGSIATPVHTKPLREYASVVAREEEDCFANDQSSS